MNFTHEIKNNFLLSNNITNYPIKEMRTRGNFSTQFYSPNFVFSTSLVLPHVHVAQTNTYK